MSTYEIMGQMCDLGLDPAQAFAEGLALVVLPDGMSIELERADAPGTPTN